MLAIIGKTGYNIISIRRRERARPNLALKFCKNKEVKVGKYRRKSRKSVKR